MANTVYSKTARGQAEIDARSLGLSARARRLLILIDGRRTLAEIAVILGHDTLPPLLAELQAQGCIGTPGETASEAGATVEPAPAPSPVQSVPPAVTQQPKPIDALDPIRIVKAKELMTESAQTFLGLMGRGLISEIEAVSDTPALKNAIARWNMALRESRKAGPYADEFVQAVKVLTGL
ncbi:hypothetical protein [Jeongeupia chitinilytica]|uniref:Uncharacterized protein n=1 Tax=Jeongeupia chitinilytica TaxID=1041641 RepID=A0ABQ3H5F4_9NEIS|nr:hypothetical protein [Jeongeupia chitinilytica]GHD68459.1 hypothetical protein GCM10007350_33780 [Jeongeupia chitinilytica]